MTLSILSESSHSYQKLLEKAKVGKHADNHEYRQFVPNPDKIQGKRL